MSRTSSYQIKSTDYIMHKTHIITKQTPCSKVLLEKLTVTQLVKKFHAFYGTQRFITVFTRAHH